MDKEFSTISFKILIHEGLKDRSIQDLYNFINRFQSIDWGLFYYGFAPTRKDIEGRPKCGSIPTNYGCIIFPVFHYDESKFIEYAKGYVSKGKLIDLEKKLEEEKFVDIQSELDRDMINKVVSGHPDVVESSAIELILPAIVKIEATPRKIEGALSFFQRQSERMKKLVDFCKNTPPPFIDVEVHQWNLRYADPEGVEEAVKKIGEREGKEEEFRDYLLEGVVAELEEEPEEKSYVIILRTDQDAKLTIRQLEERLEKALAPIKRCISKKTCFVTLVM